MTILAVTSFGRGIVLEGSADAQRTDELSACDSYDITKRGQLVATSDLTIFDSIKTSGAGTVLNPLYGIEVIGALVPVVVGIGLAGGNYYISVYTLPSGAINGGVSIGGGIGEGLLATFASFPYVTKAGVQVRVVLACIGARFAFSPVAQFGLYAVLYNPGAGTFSTRPISDYDALGTGAIGEYFIAKAIAGTNAKQLYARFVAAYNNHAFIFGYDSHDATYRDGPNRVMFSNLGNPLKWGNDPLAAAVDADPTLETDRAFLDTDAFTIGGAGEICRGACVWDKKLIVGTNKGLHYIEGFGRESFITNGAIPIKRTKNVLGPHAMIEGPDGLLYGVSDDVGLWAYDGAVADPVGSRLRNFGTKSLGYWDLIWTDQSQSLNAFPGKTNSDLVWLLSDPDAMQVWVVIPYCNAGTGWGVGTDTVILKWHTATPENPARGGFTRQVFTGKTILYGMISERDHTVIRQRFMALAHATDNLQRFAHKGSAVVTPVMPTALPDVSTTEYAPHGVDGTGVNRTVYITIAWQQGALPLVFTVTPMVDQEAVAAPVKLSITSVAPGGPTDGDLWLDTSGTDTNLGNGGSGTFTPAHAGDYLLKRWKATWAQWVYTTTGGMQGTRATVPVAFTAMRGTRIMYRVQTTAASDRYQIEGLGLEPTTIRSGG